MSSKRYTEEFKREAVKQVTEHHHSTVVVAQRLGINKHSLYAWVRDYGSTPPGPANGAIDVAELRRLRTELKRVTEERDVLKKPPRTLPNCPGEVRVHARTRQRVPAADNGEGVAGADQWLLRLAQVATEARATEDSGSPD